jgi:putative glycosyltransferase (TIGR04372 family)
MRFNAKKYMRAIGHAQAAYPVFADWGHRPPILSLSSEDDQWGKTMLHNLGLPNDAWFVCVHVREGGFSPIDEKVHSHRNGDIANISLAVQEIITRGGWVIRIGDPSMRRISKTDRVIDYAHSNLRSDRFDIYLCAKAKFILGNTSGIALVGTIFGTPSALANMVPLAALAVGPWDICIPKLHWSFELHRYLTYKEIFNSEVSKFQYREQYDAVGVRTDENTPDEIRDLTIEMFEKLSCSKNIQDDLNTNLSEQHSFFHLMNASHYSFGACSQVGQKFILQHKDLYT